jgi:hypothetical protein
VSSSLILGTYDTEEAIDVPSQVRKGWTPGEKELVGISICMLVRCQRPTPRGRRSGWDAQCGSQYAEERTPVRFKSVDPTALNIANQECRLNFPKIEGSHGNPHGACSGPGERLAMKRRSNLPSMSKTSTNPLWKVPNPAKERTVCSRCFECQTSPCRMGCPGR